MENKPPPQWVEKELGVILSDILPLTGESEVEMPGNPWLTNPKFKDRLTAVHNLVDTVKNGGKFIVIAVGPDEDEVKFFTANISKPNLIAKLSMAITKVANKLARDEPPQHT